MKAIVAILVIFLIQCANLRAEPKMPTREDMGKALNSDSCIFGVKSVSIELLYNGSSYEVKNIDDKENICNDICNDIDKSKPVVFEVHGFVSSANATAFRELGSQLKQAGYTVFAVDWSQGACTEGLPVIKFLEYPSAVQNTKEIGQYIARCVLSLNDCIPLKNITFIGHSLGAHVSGFAAKEIQKSLNDTIPQIIAADPANPLFGSKKCEERLCHEDTDCLKVFHTSSLGIAKPIGHLDIYFNGGLMQPGCGIDIACSHSRSVEYITDMIKDETCGFVCVPDENKSMKLPLVKVIPGILKSSSVNPDTKNCLFINKNILDNSKCPEINYRASVDKKSHCTQETFECEKL